LLLDPLSLPISFDAHDLRADGGVRQIELHRERVVLRRALDGMRMAVNLRVRDFLGIALRGGVDAPTLVLLHRDPSLTIPLGGGSAPEEIASAWQAWSEILALPQLEENMPRDAAPRRRRRHAIRARRPNFPLRRRLGDLLNPAKHYRSEREIIAPE
jgi:hypothetical protein